MDVPWSRLKADQRTKLLTAKTRGYVGILPFLTNLEDKKYKQYIRVFLRQYQTAQECPECHGTKLQPDALNVRIGDRDIASASELSVGDLVTWLDNLELSDFERHVATHLLKEARDRLQFLCDVGLNYLSLNRATRTLSGGEAQRITLSNSLGAQLVDTLYVLDEPSIGLHPRDMERLLGLLRRLREGGNTVIVVEHDPEAIRAADYMIELGPGSRRQGRIPGVQRLRFSHTRKSAHRRLSHRRARDSAARGAAAPRPALDHAHRRPRAQPQGRRAAHPARRDHGGDRRVRIGQEHLDPRRAASSARDAPSR